MSPERTKLARLHEVMAAELSASCDVPLERMREALNISILSGSDLVLIVSVTADLGLCRMLAEEGGDGDGD